MTEVPYIRMSDLKDRYREELQLIEVPEVERSRYVVQQHIRGIGLKPDEYVRVHNPEETTKRMIKTLLEDDNWKKWQVRFSNANELLEEALNIPLGDRWEDIEDLYKVGDFETDDGEEFELYDIKTKSTDEFSILDSSCHLDWRFEMNDHLMGISVYDPGRSGDPQKTQPVPGMNGNKTVIGEKAPHIPSQWLTVSGKERGGTERVEPGKVASTKYSFGLLITWDFGEWEMGANKPYYFEWFTYSDEIPENNELRWNARETGLPPLEPEEKLPEEERGETLRWLCWCPSGQEPYALSDRAREKKWIAEGWDPVPTYWKEDHPEEYKEYKKWVKKVREEEGRDQELQKSVPFKIKYVFSRGPVVIRGQRNEWFYLQIKTDEGLKEWKLDDNPIYDKSISALRQKAGTKYWDYVGDLDPKTKYNPHKELIAHMEDMIEGKVQYEKSTKDNIKRINLSFEQEGIEGKWILEQTEEDSDLWNFREVTEKELRSNRFTVQRHEYGDSVHWDISMTQPNTPIKEGFRKFALVDNPIGSKIGESIRIVKDHICEEPRWFDLDDQDIPPEGAPDWLKGGNPTKNFVAHVNLIDSGIFNIIEWKDRFIKVVFNGDKLNGNYIFIKRDDTWYFEKVGGPGEELISGDPRDRALDPPIVTIEEDEIKIGVFSTRFFSSALPSDEYERYDLPSVPDSVRLSLYKFPEEGTTGKVAIQSVLFDKEEWSEERALSWIEDNDISEWRATFVKD